MRCGMENGDLTINRIFFCILAGWSEDWSMRCGMENGDLTSSFFLLFQIGNMEYEMWSAEVRSHTHLMCLVQYHGC